MEALIEALTIGQLAKQAGVGVETIRFYEREGL
jgi:DNA-binding transcriptional MerR regulator